MCLRLIDPPEWFVYLKKENNGKYIMLYSKFNKTELGKILSPDFIKTLYRLIPTKEDPVWEIEQPLSGGKNTEENYKYKYLKYKTKYLNIINKIN